LGSQYKPFDTRNNKRDGKVHLKPVQTLLPACRSAGRIMRRLRCGEGDLTPDSRLYEDEGAGTRDEIR